MGRDGQLSAWAGRNDINNRREVTKSRAGCTFMSSFLAATEANSVEDLHDFVKMSQAAPLAKPNVDAHRQAVSDARNCRKTSLNSAGHSIIVKRRAPGIQACRKFDIPATSSGRSGDGSSLPQMPRMGQRSSVNLG